MKKKFVIAGVDEVGRGCLAGPVVSAAVIFKKGINLRFLRDSKKIPSIKRGKISEHIKKHSYYDTTNNYLTLPTSTHKIISITRNSNQVTQVNPLRPKIIGKEPLE